MNRMAKGLAETLFALLGRMEQKAAYARAMAERLSLAIAPLSLEELAVARRPVESRKLAAGEWHTLCVRAADGAVFSWGRWGIGT